jgi:hypothetical protein
VDAVTQRGQRALSESLRDSHGHAGCAPPRGSTQAPPRDHPGRGKRQKAGHRYCIDFQYGGFEGGNVVLVYSDGGVFDVDGVSTELAAWVGLETDPEWLAGKGVTFYEGSWYGILSSQELDFANLFEGEMGMQANFQTGDIEGKMFSNLEGPNLNAEFSGSISGNVSMGSPVKKPPVQSLSMSKLPMMAKKPLHMQSAVVVSSNSMKIHTTPMKTGLINN